MAKKVTFTLDDETVRRIELSASRLRKPKSQVVREAVAHYYDRAGRLSEAERQHLLSVLDRMTTLAPSREAAEADREIAEIRAARRAGGRRTQ